MIDRTIHKIGDICDQIRGVTYSKSDATLAPAAGFKPILRANNIKDTGLTFDDLVYIPEENIAAKQKLKANDILIAASSGSIEVVGKAARLISDFDGGFGAFCKVLRPNAKVDPSYFSHYFRTKGYRRRISFLAAGANINNLRNEHLDDLEIVLPPLLEQRRIAAILDKADALRAKRREAIAKLDQLLQSVFLEMFGDETDASVTVADIIASATAMRTGPFGSQLLHSEFVDSGIAVLGIDNAVSNKFAWGKPRYITEQKYAKLSRYRVLPGDVLITIMGTCGRCAVVPEDIPLAINTKHLCCISLDRSKCEPEFLHSYFLMHPVARNYLESRAKGAIMSGLNMGIIKELPITLPTIERQRQFVSIKMQLRQQQEQSRFQLARLEHLFAAIQDQAFSGTL
ncbi:MAG: restriction endonuclease subunit S [Gammaproteobacteria bacterium HGW-Gammaproteobacteria-12]|nr:MAG: restriction endonuclease subunit S [Gammaproteobacteria bacterium HGW-Gammaproteobacteria-12]